MTIIRSMTATFGKLEGAHLTCGPGLNLIHAPNEGGKSTWAAFYKAMLFGIDTRDRDKKGRLADKNRYQPWSGSPMEGELVVEWQGRELSIRRGPRGNTPFGSFSAVYTDSGQAVPGMTGENCGLLLTGVSREVFERSAFIGGDNLAVTPAPDLERRITALLTAGQEDVSYSQTQATLKNWLNRRKVNRTVGLIPKLEEELTQARGRLAQAEECARTIRTLEGVCARLSGEEWELKGEAEIHARLARQKLNSRYAQAEADYQQALERQERLETELKRFGTIPPKEDLKKAQFDLQYLKVLEEEIRAAQTELDQGEADYQQAQSAAQSDHFPNLSAQQARTEVESLERTRQQLIRRGAGPWTVPLYAAAVLLLCAGAVCALMLPQLPHQLGAALLILGGLCSLGGLYLHSRGKKRLEQAAKLPGKFGAETMEQLFELLTDYERRCAAAQVCADRVQAARETLNDRQARRDNSRQAIFDFVHTFAPEVKELFGCSAALSRALNLEHEQAAARERVEERRMRLDDLAAQGGQSAQTLELLHTPLRTPQETRRALEEVSARLRQQAEALAAAQGRQETMGDPAALFARVEELEGELLRRTGEQAALTIALEVLDRANEGMQRRFSPQLNTLASDYFARLTGGRYQRVALDQEMTGQVSQSGGVLPRTQLYLSRGTADQLYLAVRLAVCRLCLPELPPILLDDALVCFDDQRVRLALKLLEELSQEQQIILFTCQRREGDILEELT